VKKSNTYSGFRKQLKGFSYYFDMWPHHL